jgi:adenylate kinase
MRPVAQQYRTILLFGRPGAGKGTIGKTLGSIPGFFHLAMGDVFRDLDLNTTLGKIFVEYSSRGELVPDDATVQLWRVTVEAKIAAHRYRPDTDLLVLDGVPRNVEQAELMREYVDVQKGVHLVCTDEQALMDRLRRRALTEGRYDDASEEVIRRRWDVYARETRPIRGCYPKEIIREVDAMSHPARVVHDVLEHLLPLLEPA